MQDGAISSGIEVSSYICQRIQYTMNTICMLLKFNHFNLSTSTELLHTKSPGTMSTWIQAEILVLVEAIVTECKGERWPTLAITGAEGYKVID